MGRKTYDVLQRHGNPLAGRPRESVVVASTTMVPDGNPDVTVLSERVVEFARALKGATV